MQSSPIWSDAVCAPSKPSGSGVTPPRTQREDICGECMIDADFLVDSGFELVAPHHRFPRLRLELDEGLGWKAEVEAALERLVVEAALKIAVEPDLTMAPVGG